jgi:voltage-gated potassium channel
MIADRRLGNLILAVSLLIASIFIGLTGFMWIEKYSLIDAFYMSVITIGTVGFTEVHPLSPIGRVFTSFYILTNLAIFAYVVSVMSSYIFEGKLKLIFMSYMSERELNKLQNHVIVCGYGRNGSRACEELERSGQDFVVIEKNPEIRQSSPTKPGFKMLVADATLDNTLRLAGIDRAKVIIITTPSDAANVFITLTARALNPQITIISRASEKETEDKLFRAGANKVIMPDFLGGMFMAQLVTKPVVIEFLDLLSGVSGTSYHLEEVSYDDLKPEFKDKTLKELNVSDITGATVLGVKDNEKGLIPSPKPNTFIGIDDTLIILGNDEHLKNFMQHFTKK